MTDQPRDQLILRALLATPAPLPATLITHVADTLATLPHNRALASLLARRPEATLDDLIKVLQFDDSTEVVNVLTTHPVSTTQLWAIVGRYEREHPERIPVQLTHVLTDAHVSALLADDAPVTGAVFVTRSHRPTWVAAAARRLLHLLDDDPQRYRPLVLDAFVSLAARHDLDFSYRVLLAMISDTHLATALTAARDRDRRLRTYDNDPKTLRGRELAPVAGALPHDLDWASFFELITTDLHHDHDERILTAVDALRPPPP